MILGSVGAGVTGVRPPEPFVRQGLPAMTTGAELHVGVWGSPTYSAPDTVAHDENTGSWLAFCGNPLLPDPAAAPRRGERLLQLLATRGVRGLDEVDGNFGIVWWNARDSLLTLIRDRFGVEPLHYAPAADRLAFGSRCHDVMRLLGGAPALCWQGMVEYLAYCYLPGEHTLYDGVLRVPPGGMAEWRPGMPTPALSRWYRLSFAAPWRPDEGEITTRYRELLESAVKKRLAGDRPGILLSGGMDSSSAATFATRHLDRPLDSFSFRCGGNSFDESSYARALAAELNTRHHEVEYGERESLDILEAVPRMDTPFCDIGIEIGTWVLAKAAGGSAGYLLTGDGGDEIWASHPVYAAQRMMKWYDRMPLPSAVRRGLARMLDLAKDGNNKRGLAVVMKRILPPPEVPAALGHFRWRLYHTPASLDRLLTPAAARLARQADMYRPVLRSFEGYDGPDDGMSKWLYSDYTTVSGFYFSRLLLAREFGLDVRLPFYDKDLVEYGARIPAHLKLEGIERTKRLFRVAMEGVLPDVINHRKDKLGHSVPLKNWLRGEGELVQRVRATLASDRFLERGLFEPEAVRTMLREHEERRHNHSHRLWALFVLEHWMRARFDQVDRQEEMLPLRQSA